MNWQTHVTPETEAALLRERNRIVSMTDAPDDHMYGEVSRLPQPVQGDVLMYWSEMWGQPGSSGLPIYDLNILVSNLEWWKKERKKRGMDKIKRPAISPEQRIENLRAVNPAYAAWLEQCAAKQKYLEEKRTHWRKLIAERRQVVESYNASINAVKAEIKEAEGWDVGPAPAKTMSTS